MVLKKILKKENSNFLLFFIFTLCLCNFGITQNNLNELLIKSYKNKISSEFLDLKVRGSCSSSSLENLDVETIWSADSSIAVITNSKLVKPVINKILHSDQRIGVYFSGNNNVYFISGFQSLDLKEFFNYCELGQAEMNLTFFYSRDLSITIFEFISDLKRYNKKRCRKMKRLNSKFKILIQNYFANSEVN